MVQECLQYIYNAGQFGIALMLSIVARYGYATAEVVTEGQYRVVHYNCFWQVPPEAAEVFNQVAGRVDLGAMLAV